MAKYRALTDLSLRQSSDKEDPKYNEWFEWPEGKVFEPPEHMDIKKALKRGIVELVEADKKVTRG
jgi:hypothetical protein